MNPDKPICSDDARILQLDSEYGWRNYFQKDYILPTIVTME